MIVLLLYYENGTNDGTPEGHARNSTGNERQHKNQLGKKINANQAELLARLEAKIKSEISIMRSLRSFKVLSSPR
jgi:uncharacterized protein YPO0396